MCLEEKEPCSEAHECGVGCSCTCKGETYVLPHRAQDAHAFLVAALSDANWPSMPCDTEELRLHVLDVGETPDLRWNQDAICDLSVIKRNRILRCCAWSMQNSGTGDADAGLGPQYES